MLLMSFVFYVTSQNFFLTGHQNGGMGRIIQGPSAIVTRHCFLAGIANVPHLFSTAEILSMHIRTYVILELLMYMKNRLAPAGY